MQRSYSIPIIPHVTQQGALPRLVIDHPLTKGEIFLQGAHLTHWQPAGQAPVLYASPKTLFATAKPIRGGVPVCFPWFGPHPAEPNLPSHGFARLMSWDVVGVSETPVGPQVHLQLGSDDTTHEFWRADFIADLRFTLGRELEMKLSVSNTGEEPISFEAALHTYFVVSDVRSIGIAGLKGAEYLDKMDGMKRKTESDEAIRFVAETDRVYVNTDATCTIDDPGMDRAIEIAKSGSKSTVVWNPFPKRAGELADLGEENWSGFVCVETANAGENAITLPAGRTHEMTAHVKVVSR